MTYIAFEGPDGCGKTTQIELAKNYLESKSKKVCVVREPGGTKYGSSIREILLGTTDLSPMAVLLAMFSDRAELMGSVIKPKMEEGYVVLSDRSLLSSYVYQYHVDKACTLYDITALKRMVYPSARLLPFIIILDADPETLRGRIKDRGVENHYDSASVEVLNKRRMATCNLVGECSNGYSIINATDDIETVSRRIQVEIDKLV